MKDEGPRRYVLDTNVLVSAFLFPQSTPGKVLEVVLSGHRLLFSLELARELAEVLDRDKFDRFLTRKRREELIAGTIRSSEFIETSTSVAACRDPKDNKILELAIDGSANAVITGDADLLELGLIQRIPIVSPHDFLSRWASA